MRGIEALLLGTVGVILMGLGWGMVLHVQAQNGVDHFEIPKRTWYQQQDLGFPEWNDFVEKVDAFNRELSGCRVDPCDPNLGTFNLKMFNEAKNAAKKVFKLEEKP